MIKKQSFLILFLFIFAISGVGTFLDRGTTYIGNNAIDAGVVQHLQESYIQYLYDTEIVQPANKELLNNITVTDFEIEEYRNYYGTLSEQIESIKSEYVEPTDEERQIRDEKIAEIRQNFADDEAVRKKIQQLKKTTIENYLRENEQAIEPFDKGKHFEYNIEIAGKPFKEKTESSQVIRELTETYSKVSDTMTLNPVHYMSNAISLPFDVVIEYPATVITVKLLDSIYSDANYGDEIENFEWRKMAFYMLWLITGLVIVYLVIERKQIVPAIQDVLMLPLPKQTSYIDVNAVIVLIGSLWSFKLIDAMANLVESFVYNLYYGYTMIHAVTSAIYYILLVTVAIITFVVAMKLYTQLREKSFTKEQFISSKLVDYVQEVFYNRSLGLQMLAAIVVFACAGFGIAVVMMQPVALAVYIPLFILIVVPTLTMFLRRFAHMSRIIQHTEKLANGESIEPLKVKGKSIIASHAQHINALQKGVKESVQAQAKSERLKTELITNVSHDLRTPLTSIITYTDLLKSDNLTDEERQKYVAILETKSHRLKTLLEDLFEVSKMASGNMTITRQQIDLAQLLQQIVAEHEEDFEQASLALRIAIEEQSLLINADGQKLWRVIDNLLINARKYSLSHTRVYITLKNEGNEALLTIKNVTKYELGENVDELAERFKRGDASRNTDGSGLGLAIAQSIVELHGGTMQIELNGDLFQVSIRLPQ